MPSETEQLKVTVSLTNEDRIVIVTDNYADFQNYTTNGQKDKSTTFCMLDGKLLRIQVNNVSHQKDNTNQLEIKSISTTNGDACWNEEKGVKELFGFQKVGEKKKIEIFKSLGSRVEKLAGEKGELQTQLTQAEQEKQKLEADKKETEEKQQQLIEQLNALQEKEEDTAKLKEHLNELKVQINSLQEQLDKISETKKKELEDAKQEAEEEKTNLQTQLNEALQKLKEAEQLKSDFIAHLKKEGEESRRQVQELVGELQEKNEELETAVQELLQGLDRINESLETEELNAEVIEELDRLYKEKEKIIAKLIIESLNKNAPPRELEGKDKQIKELSEQVQKLQQEKEEFETNNLSIANLQQQLKTKGEEIAQLNAEVEKLKKDLAA
ncbi:MAG: hypothetical protein LBC34_02265, partial [Rickettsiales bacterium]|nr:hypothetical protein [Rickettsiales bacterium]